MKDSIDRFTSFSVNFASMEASYSLLAVTTLTNSYIIILFVFSVLFIYLVMSFYHQLDKKKDEDLLRMQELADRIQEQLREKDSEIEALKNEFASTYKTQFETIGSLIEQALGPKSEQKRQEDLLAAAHKAVEDFTDPSRQQEREEQINFRTDNIMAHLREDFPSFKEQDFQLLSFVIIGFDATLISIILDITPGTFYTRKSRLRDRIYSSGSGHLDQYRRWIG